MVHAFVTAVRNEVFPMLQGGMQPRDMGEFEETYIRHDRSSFLTAWTAEGQLRGCIGIVPYDGRIQSMEGRFESAGTAEIVRCYVHPDARRFGIGTRLVEEALRYSHEAGYNTLYLHTHRFLNGAVDFWVRQGFTVILDEQDECETVHMERRLR